MNGTTAEYAAGGVPEYYILHRAPEHQAFFTRTAAGVYVPIAPEDGVIRSRVLPGLQLRVADLCRRPEHDTLRDDPVYAAFVLPGWRAAEERAAAEANRADTESNRAAAEAQACRQAERRAQEAEQALARLQAQLAGRDAAR